MSLIEALPADKLCRIYDLDLLDFQDTGELEDLREPLGQDRAVDAIRFGIGIRHQGFNLFAFGPPGTGKTEAIRLYLEPQAASQPMPEDWCYVNDFSTFDRPKAMKLPAGRATELADQMETLGEELRVVISTAFDSEDYQTRIDVIMEQSKLRQEKVFNDLQEKTAEKDIALIRTPMGFALAPVQDGKALDPEGFSQLPKEKQEEIKKDISHLEGDLQTAVRLLPDLERQQRQEIRDLNREVTDFAVRHLIEENKQHWKECEQVLTFLDNVRDYVIGHGDVFRVSPEQLQQAGPPGMMPDILQRREQVISNCQINVLISHEANGGAPIIYEDNPTVENLIGRIEHRSQFGALTTDFRLIKAGALHRANGGYLILDARRLLLQPFAWEALKRELRSREIRIESMAQLMSLSATVSLQPETIPLDVKVILIGDPTLYYLLSSHDPDFHELFKVIVDFDDRMPVTEESTGLYARYIATLARSKDLRPLDPGAVKQVLTRMSRLVGDKERLSSHVRSLADLLSEADHWASVRSGKTINEEDVRTAIDAHIRRSDRLRERTQEQFERNIINLDTSGERVGQINGLSVLQLGDFAFGRPCRITARVRLGKGQLIDIEREVELGGPLHSKGMLILSNFLAARFVKDRPLSLNASLVFEQSYGKVDGDSASSTELYALLSALADAPIKQSLAVTGSVNQFGEVQAIGGVNEKIEAFFDLCEARGLTGNQGVLIPAVNVTHLMLKEEVVAAAELGRFHIYPIATIDEGIELLTGMTAGNADAEGDFPKDSLNGRVQAQLGKYADMAIKFAKAGQEMERKGKENGGA